MALTAAAVALIGAIVVDNIISVPGQCPRLEAVMEFLDPRDAQTKTNAVRKGLIQKGLPLHEGKYWKKSYE